MPSVDYTLDVLNKTKPENALDRDGKPMTHMADALVVLNNLPRGEQEDVLEVVQDLKKNVNQRGFGEGAALEVLVALARYMEREEK